LSGVQSSGKTDGGTGSNMFGQLLTWLQESKEKHYIVATCNDIGILLELSQGALMRRFDDVFFVDLPSEKERKDILSIMVKRYNAGDIAKKLQKVETKGWTGAEIEKLVKSALYDGVEVAASRIKPIAIQNRDIIQKAREWAEFNAIMANDSEKEELTVSRKIS